MQAGTAYVRRGLWRGNVGYALRMRFSDEAKSVDQVAKEGMRELIDSIRMDPNRILRTNTEKKVEISQILKAPPRYIPKSLAASSAPGVIRQFYAMPTFFPNRQFISSFLTQTGKILPKRVTYLRPKVQRELARRVKMMRQMSLLPFDRRARFREAVSDEATPSDTFSRESTSHKT